MRLSNAIDRSHVSGAVTDNLEGLLGAMPSLRTGEAIIVGEAVHLPMRTLVLPPPPNRRPESRDPKVYTADEEPGGWNSRRTREDYAEVVSMWRKQDHRSERLVQKERGVNMNRIPVQSSNLAEVGWDRQSLTLEILFHDGRIYQYFDVSEGVYQELMNPSVGTPGTYFAANIKGTYRYARL